MKSGDRPVWEPGMHNFRYSDLLPEAFVGSDQWLSLKPQYASFLSVLTMVQTIEEGPREQILAFQTNRLRQLLNGAMRHSAYWRERIPVGHNLLAELPILRRADIRGQVEREGSLPLPEGHGQAVQRVTSGSTGQPVTFYVSAYNAFYNQHRNYYDVFVQGRDLVKPFTVSRSKIMPGRLPHWPGIIGQMFRTGPFRAIKNDTLTLEAIATAIAAEPVGHLTIQPHLLSGMLDMVEAGTIRLIDVGQISTFAETVDDALRARVQRLLGSRISDRYACEEIGPIAFQCPKDDRHYHVATSNVVVECVDEDGIPAAPGTLGRVLVTGLHSHATPFVRYELGDLAELRSSCPCGHAGPALSQMLGRQRSLLQLPDGQRRFLRFTGEDWKDVALVQEYRVIQTARDTIEAELVTDRPLSAEETAKALKLLRSKSHPDFKVSVRRVERINWGPSYKRLDVVCLVE